jgi:hypothetical protein
MTSLAFNVASGAYQVVVFDDACLAQHDHGLRPQLEDLTAHTTQQAKPHEDQRTMAVCPHPVQCLPLQLVCLLDSRDVFEREDEAVAAP